MSDAAQLAQAVEAARRVDVDVGPRKFQLLLPTEFEWRAAAENNMLGGQVKEAQLFHQLLRTAVIGWEGVTQSDIAPGDESPLPFSVAARDLLLDNNMEIADLLSIAMSVKNRARKEARRAALKN